MSDEHISAFAANRQLLAAVPAKKNKKKIKSKNESIVKLFSIKQNDLCNQAGENMSRSSKKRKRNLVQEEAALLENTPGGEQKNKKQKKKMNVPLHDQPKNPPDAIKKKKKKKMTAPLNGHWKADLKEYCSSPESPKQHSAQTRTALGGNVTYNQIKMSCTSILKNSFDATETEINNSVENSNGRNLIQYNSIEVGKDLFSWLISPVEPSVFFKTIWETKPLFIKRRVKSFYSEVCTLNDLKSAFEKEDMYFTKNVDVTSYINGNRVTENPVGKVKPSIVWDLYSRGKSIRLLNPQTFLTKVRILTTSLQDFFRCFVGANIYLTPPNSQGFAPHYDDIEAFVLQLEGRKHWKLYNPRCSEESLPRESSKNFKDSEIGTPILEVTLEAGDLLYFPRGIIHQAYCTGENSLHITVSCYQKNSWADLIEKALPVALQKAIEENVEFREGLPINYLDHLGLVHSDSNSLDRKEMLQKFERLMKKLLDYCPIDACADQLGKNFIHDALPPVHSQYDLDHGASDAANYESLFSSLNAYSNKKLGVKLIRAYACRLISEDRCIKLCYNTENSIEYHGEELMCFDIPIIWAPMIDCLIKRYPAFTDVHELNASDAKKISWKKVLEFVYELWRKGLLLFDRPLTVI